MEDSTLRKQEGSEEAISKYIGQLAKATLGAEAPTCHVCGDHLSEGETVSVYAFRRCPHAIWQIGQVRCTDHPLVLNRFASLGVSELHVRGRVGTCSDHARQDSWPVLLAPTAEAVSSVEAEGARTLASTTAEELTECPIASAALESHPTLPTEAALQTDGTHSER